MKFSVLIPTHNRLEFLKHAIFSVMSQDEDDFEVVVSDNFSEQDIKGYIHSLNDPRIKYVRTDSFISVTENWNNALEHSSGEWVVMLGDDDCLMNGYFKMMRKLIDDFSNPDFIFTNAFLFAYPHVLPQYPKGLAKTFGNAGFFNGKTSYLLPPEEAQQLVKKTFDFRCVFSFNMQFALIRSSFIDQLKRDQHFFHSPYPDYYAMTSLMMFGKRIVVCPYPMVAVGISPKSFGYYYFNNKESEGLHFLNNSAVIDEKLKGVVLPGTNMNTSWLISLNEIKNKFPENKIKLNYKRYRLIQVCSIYRKCLIQKEPLPLRELWRGLTFFEKFTLGFPLICLRIAPRKIKEFVVRIFEQNTVSHQNYPVRQVDGEFDHIREFYEKIDPVKFVDSHV